MRRSRAPQTRPRGRHRHRAPRAPSRVLRGLARGCGALLSVSAMLLTGAGWWAAHGMLGGITVSQALGSGDPRSAGGAMNILLIGLDSRKDQDGDPLPAAILDRLHAGDSDSGGYNTNTLILVHIGADDAVVAFSIPRDDWVSFSEVPGYRHIKIKEAYGLTKAYAEDELVEQGVTSQHTLERRGREAGRAATLRAVRALTGVPIDYFAEVNLAGFYDLTQSLGGVQVCLKHAVRDQYSGANFPAGRQTLNAEQALAFVRQRHGLDNGDLDRTHRQQAFLVSVMHQLQGAGTFTDLGKLKSLMAVVRKDVVLSQGWDEDLFRRMGALAGGDVQYRTLPVLRYATIDGQDVNIVDPAAIRAEVAAAFGIDTTPDPLMVVDVVNASSTTGLAARVAKVVAQHGYTTGAVRDRGVDDPASTEIDYGPGADIAALTLATLLGIDTADTAAKADPNLAAGQIRVILGDDYSLPAEHQTTSATTTTTTSTSTSTSTEATPDHGPPVDGGDIPCVN